MTKPYQLVETTIDAKRIRGYESNNLIVQGEAISELFTFKGESNSKKVIPFDYSLYAFKMERASTSTGTWQMQLVTTTPRGTKEDEIYLGTDALILSQSWGTSLPFEAGSTIFFEDLTTNPEENKELILTVYLKRIKIIEL